MSVIYDLLGEVKTYGGLSSIYFDKMMHPIPKTDVINREQFLLEAAKGRVILDIGASGPMSEALRRVAAEYHGLNNSDNPGVANWYSIDLDKTHKMPVIDGLEIIIAGEVIEHLSNAGHFLDLLREYKCPVILTTVNAYNSVGAYHVSRGIENVNIEHVAYYSYHTLKTLVERHGYNILQWYWYKGQPGVAEGLIFCMEGKDA